MLFTVFTPTYNRENTLHRVYNSLIDQTCKDFEWLIIDDGSSDGTQSLVETWIRENVIRIRYYRKTNGGKHTAHNLALKKAKGEYFVILDSDDACTPDALEAFKGTFEKFSAHPNLVSVICNCQRDGKLYGAPLPITENPVSFLDLKHQYKIIGEKWGCSKTSILKQYPFPYQNMNTYIPEGIVWNAIAQKYTSICIQDCLRIYNENERGGSITQVIDPSRNSFGNYQLHRSIMNTELSYFMQSPLYFFKSSIFMVRMGLLQNKNLRTMWSDMNSSFGRLLISFWFVGGLLLYIRDSMLIRLFVKNGTGKKRQ